jgi:hypothetical protein
MVTQPTALRGGPAGIFDRATATSARVDTGESMTSTDARSLLASVAQVLDIEAELTQRHGYPKAAGETVHASQLKVMLSPRAPTRVSDGAW